jgi:hypothetical protein
VTLRVRGNAFSTVEINFLCIHKKLRSKRLAPVLIKEITRRCHLEGIWEAVYTAGVVLPKPIATCRYYHRSLSWLKLYETGFSPLPTGSTTTRMIKRNQLPDTTQLKGLRMMETEDVKPLTDLLKQYLSKFDLAPIYSEEEVRHWFLHTGDDKTRVIWTYVVEVYPWMIINSRTRRRTRLQISSHFMRSHRLSSITRNIPRFERPISSIMLQPRPRRQSKPTRNDYRRWSMMFLSLLRNWDLMCLMP